MTYRITKQFYFSASHQLEGLSEDHPCTRIHGHNYIIEIVLQSEQLDQIGFVIDYGQLNVLEQYIANTLDHRHLNDVFSFNPTTENIAKYLFDFCIKLWPQTEAIRVSETSRTRTEYRR